MATNDSLARFRALQESTSPRMFNSDTTSSAIEGNAQAIEAQKAQIQAYLESVRKAQEQSQPNESNMPLDGTTEPSYDMNEPMVAGSSGSVLPGKAPITQTFGQKSKYDVFSGGTNYGVDFGIKEGTPLAVPPGEWKVIQAFGGAKNKGYIGDKTNSGYGNSILVMNPKTGETLRFSHLKGINVQPGQSIPGGTVIGLSGGTGNATNPHLDLEYRNASGQLSDVLKSSYARSLFGGSSMGTSNGRGGGMANTGNKVVEALRLLSSLVPKTLPIKDQIAQIKSLTPEQINEQAFDLITAGTVRPLYAKKGLEVLPQLQNEMSKNLMKYRRVLKPWNGPMEEVMSNSLNKFQPIIKEIPRLLKDGVSKFK